jgi:hypothetical protein
VKVAQAKASPLALAHMMGSYVRKPLRMVGRTAEADRRTSDHLDCVHTHIAHRRIPSIQRTDPAMAAADRALHRLHAHTSSIQHPHPATGVALPALTETVSQLAGAHAAAAPSTDRTASSLLLRRSQSDCNAASAERRISGDTSRRPRRHAWAAWDTSESTGK